MAFNPAFGVPIPSVVLPDGGNLEQYRLDRLDGLEDGVKRGNGAYGSVYEVRVNGIPCIAKRLHDILVGSSISEKQRIESRRNFRKECELLSKLRHPNIVQFLGVHFGADPNDLTLVMEYLHTDLEGCVEQYKGAMPLSIKLAILLDVSYGLLHLHSQHPTIIHRDLTAGNVLLTPDMRAKLADLGVSRIIDFSLSTQMNRFTGCPGAIPYMPPEALRQNPKYDVKLDIFSFGILTLFVVIEELPAYYIEAHISEDSLRKGRAQIEKRKGSIDKIPQDHCLGGVVLSCLMDDPKIRPSTNEINQKLMELSAQHPKNFGNVIEMHQALKERPQVPVRVESEERDALLRQVETLTQENSRLSSELEARRIQEDTFREDFSNERKDRENLASKNEGLERANLQLTQDLDREKQTTLALQQQLEEHRRHSLQREDTMSPPAELQHIAQQLEASSQAVDPVAQPFDVGPVQAGNPNQKYNTQPAPQRMDPGSTNPLASSVNYPKTLPYRSSPTQGRRNDLAQTPSTALLRPAATPTLPLQQQQQQQQHISPTHRLVHDSNTPLYSPSQAQERRLEFGHAPVAVQKSSPPTILRAGAVQTVQASPLSSSPDPGRNNEQRYDQKVPSATPHRVKHSQSGDLPPRPKPPPPIISQMSSPDGTEPHYQNLDRRFLEGLAIEHVPQRERASHISGTAHKPKPLVKDQSRGKYVNVEIEGSLSRSCTVRAPVKQSDSMPSRKYSEGSRHNMFSQSADESSHMLEMMRDGPSERQTIPGEFKGSPPQSSGFIATDMPLDAVAFGGSGLLPVLSDLKRSRSYGDSFDKLHVESFESTDLPYDPNLVCPNCGLQFRDGEIQKLRKHYQICGQ